MPRKVSFYGNTITLHDEAPQVKLGDRVSFTVHDWHEGDHTLTGEVVALAADAVLGLDVVRVRIGVGIERDVAQNVPVAALTVVAPVVPFRGGR